MNKQRTHKTVTHAPKTDPRDKRTTKTNKRKRQTAKNDGQGQVGCSLPIDWMYYQPNHPDAGI